MSVLRTWRLLVSAVLLVAILVWPLLPKEPEPMPGGAADIVLVIDRTTSMGATDWNGTQPRAAGVATDIEAIAAAAPNARFAVVVVDNAARVSMPWTTDTRALVTLGRTVGWREIQHGAGSTIGSGTSVAGDLLQLSAERRPDTPRYLIYLGDGEQTSDRDSDPIAPLTELLDGALVLGYGTREGATMPTSPGSNELVEINGEPQKSRIDEARLQQLAKELEGRYEHRTGPGPVEVWEAATAPAPPPPEEPVLPVVWVLNWIVVVLVAWELVVTAHRTRVLQQEVR